MNKLVVISRQLLVVSLALFILAGCSKEKVSAPLPPAVHTSATADSLTFYVYSLQFTDSAGGPHLDAAGIFIKTFYGTTQTDSLHFINGHTSITCKYAGASLDTVSNKKLNSAEDSALVQLHFTFAPGTADTLKVYDVIPIFPGYRLDAVFAVADNSGTYTFTRTWERSTILAGSTYGTYSGVHISGSGPYILTDYLP